MELCAKFCRIDQEKVLSDPSCYLEGNKGNGGIPNRDETEAGDEAREGPCGGTVTTSHRRSNTQSKPLLTQANALTV